MVSEKVVESPLQVGASYSGMPGRLSRSVGFPMTCPSTSSATFEGLWKVEMLESSALGDQLVISLQVFLLGSFIWFSYATFKTLKPRNDHELRSVAILVLGDIGRSPRMMYHAQSFAENGFVTDLIGYAGMDLIRSNLPCLNSS